MIGESISIESDGQLTCNETCCQMSTGSVVCFGDRNFTDRANITYPEAWDQAVRWTYAILVMFVAVLGNLAIIIILAKNRLLLRTSVNYFILNMSVADLLTALAGPIPFTIRDIAYFWVLGEAWCYLEGYIQMLVMLVSVTSLATISFDRMMGVVRPFHTHLKTWQSLTIIVVIWAVSAVLAVPFAVYRKYSVTHWRDLTEKTCGEETAKIAVWWKVSVIGLIWLPLFVMIVCYTTILIYFSTYKFKVNKKGEHPAITHLKRRVVVMMFVVVIAFTICWLPFQLLKIGTKFFLNENGSFRNDATEKSYDTLMTVSHYVLYTNPAINPIIYALMHQTFRRASRVTFPCFYNHKSVFVLTPGEGRQKYVWSKRSTSNTYNNMLAAPRQHLPGRGRRTEMSRAVVNSASLAACIAIEPISEENQEDKSSEDSRKSENKSVGARLNEARGKPCYTTERYVRDLAPRRISIVSTGTLGQLITQVIEEETSSDVESERAL